MFAAIHAIDNCLQSKSQPPVSLLSISFSSMFYLK